MPRWIIKFRCITNVQLCLHQNTLLFWRNFYKIIAYFCTSTISAFFHAQLFFMPNMNETGYSRNQCKRHQADVKHTLLLRQSFCCCQVKIDEDILDNKDVCCNKRCAEKLTYLRNPNCLGSCQSFTWVGLQSSGSIIENFSCWTSSSASLWYKLEIDFDHFVHFLKLFLPLLKLMRLRTCRWSSCAFLRQTIPSFFNVWHCILKTYKCF